MRFVANCFLVVVLFNGGTRAVALEETKMPQTKNRIGLAIHGGAGTIERGKMTPERESEYRAGLERSLAAGYEILKRGGSSLDATEAAVRVLEDDPHFNAGRGAVFTNAGTNELDAAIMEGKGLKGRRSRDLAPHQEPDLARADDNGKIAARFHGGRRRGGVCRGERR